MNMRMEGTNWTNPLEERLLRQGKFISQAITYHSQLQPKSRNQNTDWESSFTFLENNDTSSIFYNGDVYEYDTKMGESKKWNFFVSCNFTSKFHQIWNHLSRTVLFLTSGIFLFSR